MENLKLVLIIDDNQITQFLSSKIIQSTGLVNEIQCFSQGEEALLFLTNAIKQPDLIMLDLEMPIMDGWEFLELYTFLTANVIRPAKVCVLTSSLNIPEKYLRKKYPIVSDYIVKPITPEKFIALLNS